MATSLAAHLASLPVLADMRVFPTVEALQAAYATHLLDTGKAATQGDANWEAQYNTKYDPMLTKRGSYIEDFGYSTERDPILAAAAALRVNRQPLFPTE